MPFLIWIALIPSIVIAFLINKADKKEKEPVTELLKAFIMGIVAIVLTLILSYILSIHEMKIESDNFLQVIFYSFVCISFIEEGCKWICSYLFLHNNKNFDYLFDGIVYVVFVSLGFATVENLLYTFSGGIVTAIIRSITTVPAHSFFGVFSGYYLSLSKKEKLNSNSLLSRIYFILSLMIPILLHGFYDFCLLTENYIFYLIYIVFIVSLYCFSIYHIKKLSQIETMFH